MNTKFILAQEYFEKVLNINPKQILSLWGKNKNLRIKMMNQPEKALNWYDKALTINPQHVLPLWRTGDCLSILCNFNLKQKIKNQYEKHLNGIIKHLKLIQHMFYLYGGQVNAYIEQKLILGDNDDGSI